jgi:tRNA(Arg) A34 adenosine deaminase TadA
MAKYYMQQVIALATDSLEQGELPIAAIVVLDDEIISQATASELSEKRFLGHAELVALEHADRQHLSYDQRNRAQLYTNDYVVRHTAGPMRDWAETLTKLRST